MNNVPESKGEGLLAKLTRVVKNEMLIALELCVFAVRYEITNFPIGKRNEMENFDWKEHGKNMGRDCIQT